MPVSEGDDLPDVLPCPGRPDWECVRRGSPAQGGPVAAPPPGPAPEGQPAGLCPEGYVPRKRHRRAYDLEGKRIVRRDDEG